MRERGRIYIENGGKARTSEIQPAKEFIGRKHAKEENTMAKLCQMT